MEKYISLKDLRKVKGIGDKTIERVKEQLLQNELEGNYKSEYNPNIKLDVNEIHQGDCLELMNGIPDGSIDMILCDLPYGTTACKWDVIIPFEPLWKQYKRMIKKGGAIVLFGNEPFASALRMSNIKEYKYDWIWNKITARGHLVAKIRPMQQNESISVFGKGKINYYPIMEERDKPITGTEGKRTDIMGGISTGYTKVYTHKYPKTLLTFKPVCRGLHPTQKPVALFEYLIKTYTNEGETVLDNCIGSGTTGVACVNLNRNFIGIELDDKYFEIAKQRISEAQNTLKEEINKK